jgi:hypothetical protein
MKPVTVYKVHLTAEGFLQLEPQTRDVQERDGTRPLHEEVDIAVRRCRAPTDRSKYL